MGYQKLYFENSTYKYYVRKHMQVLKIQKKAYKEHFQHRSGKKIATGWEPLCSENITLLRFWGQNHNNVFADQVTINDWENYFHPFPTQ